MSTVSLDRPLFSASVSFDCALSPGVQLLGSSRHRFAPECVASVFLLVPLGQAQRVSYQVIPELGAANE